MVPPVPRLGTGDVTDPAHTRTRRHCCCQIPESQIELFSAMKVAVQLAVANLDDQFKRGQVGSSSNLLASSFTEVQ